MSLPLVFIGANKGGVDKSLASMAIVDYWLTTDDKKPVFLTETGTSNPDVAKANGETVLDLVNERDGQRKAAVVCILAAQANSHREQFGATLLTALRAMKRPAACLWIINHQRDSLELLAEFREMAPGVKIHLLRNTDFGDERKFELYNGSEIRKEIDTRQRRQWPAYSNSRSGMARTWRGKRYGIPGGDGLGKRIEHGAAEEKCSGPGKFRVSVEVDLNVSRLSIPRINDGDTSLVELAAVAGYDRHSMVGGAGSDHKVGLRKCVSGLPALFD